jgi:hypothetical protein
MSLDELLALDVTVPAATAARAFGMSPAKASELIRAGKFPCPVLELGGRRMVTRSALLAVLGVAGDARTDPAPRGATLPGAGYAIFAIPVSEPLLRELLDRVVGPDASAPGAEARPAGGEASPAGAAPAPAPQPEDTER